MKEEKRCPKCGSKEKVKNGYNRGKQRYLCKECGRNYTGTKNGYPESTKREALRYYTEGMGFRQIERLMHVSHVTVINWVKKAAEELRRVEEEKKVEKEIEVIELDEMCISFKKTFGCGQQQIGKVKNQWDMKQEQEKQNILKDYRERYHIQSQKNMPQINMKHII